MNYPPPEITPEEFEKFVKEILDECGRPLTSYKSTHRETILGTDGNYEFDIVARFEALSANFLVVIECKKYKKAVERQPVQALWAKMQSVAAHKGIVCSTSGFQSGAVEFAKAHGIALVEIADGRTSFITRSFSDRVTPVPWSKMPKEVSQIVGWLWNDNTRSLVEPRYMEVMAKFLEG